MSLPFLRLSARPHLKALAAVRTRGQSIRLLFSESRPRKDSEWKKYSAPVFSGLLIFGLSLTAYELYQRFHGAVTMWPQKIRQNLRKGLYAKRKGDFANAVLYLSRAWVDTKDAPLDTLGPDPLLKLSGVAITLAGVLEDAGQKEQAYHAYEWGLLQMIHRASELTQYLTVADKIRALSIAYKLGELANTLQRPSDEEQWLTFCADLLFRIMSEGAAHRKVELKTFEELDLPSWAMLNDFSAPFEALASFYDRTGRSEYALFLYLQAYAFILSDSRLSSTVEGKCRAAQLLGNLAEINLRSHPSDNIPPEVLATEEARLNAALQMTRAARNPVSFSRCDICEEVYTVLLYNIGMVRQFAGDVDTARKHFQQSLHQAETINMQEGISVARAALSKLDSSE